MGEKCWEVHSLSPSDVPCELSIIWLRRKKLIYFFIKPVLKQVLRKNIWFLLVQLLVWIKNLIPVK